MSNTITKLIISKCMELLPVKSSGNRTVHEVSNPSTPAISLARVELGAVSGVRHQIPLRITGHSSTYLVIN